MPAKKKPNETYKHKLVDPGTMKVGLNAMDSPDCVSCEESSVGAWKQIQNAQLLFYCILQ